MQAILVWAVGLSTGTGGSQLRGLPNVSPSSFTFAFFSVDLTENPSAGSEAEALSAIDWAAWMPALRVTVAIPIPRHTSSNCQNWSSGEVNCSFSKAPGSLRWTSSHSAQGVWPKLWQSSARSLVFGAISRRNSCSTKARYALRITQNHSVQNAEKLPFLEETGKILQTIRERFSSALWHRERKRSRR